MLHPLRINLLLLVLLLLPTVIQAQLYQPDPKFLPLQVKNQQGYLNHLIVQRDQKILVNGGYDFIKNQPSTRFNRLHGDGSPDTSFHPAPGLYSPGWLALRKDNKIVAANIYTNSTGKNTVTVFLLHPNGQIDSTLETNIEHGGVLAPKAMAVHTDNTVVLGSILLENGIYQITISRIKPDGSSQTLYRAKPMTNSWITSLHFQPDGKILALGAFPQENGQTNYLLRLNQDGSVDNAFGPVTFLNPSCLVMLPDGKLLVGNYGTLIRLNGNGTVDTTFPGIRQNWHGINSVALQADGKIMLLVSVQDQLNSDWRYKAVRLNADGSLDPLFQAGEGASEGFADLLAVQADGNVLVGGHFEKYNGKTNVALIRLSGSDGNLETAFAPNIESNGYITSVVRQPDGKLIVGGGFETANGQPARDLVRVHTDGRIDTTFKIGTGIDGFWDINGGSIHALALQTDNRILVGGHFKSFNGKTVYSLLRLQPDGSVDPSFNAAITERYQVHSLLVQADGKILVGGDGHMNFEFKKNLFRLNADGSLDPGFLIGDSFNGGVTKIVSQPDGKLLVAGYFTAVQGHPAGNLTRLLSDGTRDGAFTATNLEGDVFNSIRTVVVQPDGKILVGGGFTTFNGKPIPKLVRLHTDGNVDSSFTPELTAHSQVSSVIVKPNGGLVVGGYFPTLFNRAINGLSSIGKQDYSVFVFEELDVFAPGLLASGQDLYVLGSSRVIRLARQMMDQSITFAPIADQLITNKPFAVGVSTSSKLPVTLTVVEGPAALSGDTIILKGEPGKVTIRASQQGNDFYKPAAPVEQSFMVNAVLGLENPLEKSTTLFPNPAHGEFTINVPASSAKTSIQLIDSRGQLVKAYLTAMPAGISLKVGHLPAGMYMVRIKQGDQVINKKVVLTNQ